MMLLLCLPNCRSIYMLQVQGIVHYSCVGQYVYCRSCFCTLFTTKLAVVPSSLHTMYASTSKAMRKKMVCLRHRRALLCELHLVRRATRWPLFYFIYFVIFYFCYFLLLSFFLSHPSKLGPEQMRGKLDFEEFGV